MSDIKAATVLTDERIEEIARQECDEDQYGFILNKEGRYSVNSFARAIEREVLAHAGVGAAKPVLYARQWELDGEPMSPKHGILTSKTVDGDWSVPLYLSTPSPHAQAAVSEQTAAAVRHAALEEAALVCESIHMKSGGFMREDAPARDCVAAIRALSSNKRAEYENKDIEWLMQCAEEALYCPEIARKIREKVCSTTKEVVAVEAPSDTARLDFIFKNPNVRVEEAGPIGTWSAWHVVSGETLGMGSTPRAAIDDALTQQQSTQGENGGDDA